MKCETVRKGHECPFMTLKGCSYNEGSCQPVVDQCDGCRRVIKLPTGEFCKSFAEPAVKWKNGICNMATHKKLKVKKSGHKLNPIKAAKRARQLEGSDQVS